MGQLDHEPSVLLDFPGNILSGLALRYLHVIHGDGDGTALVFPCDVPALMARRGRGSQGEPDLAADPVPLDIDALLRDALAICLEAHLLTHCLAQ